MHWINYGKEEGRICNPFDWQLYLNRYEDLRNAGIDNEKKAWTHWINYGRAEGRICTIKEWEINNISDKESNNYFNLYKLSDDIKIAYEDDKTHLNCKYITISNRILYNFMKEDIIEFYNYKNSIKYKVYKIDFIYKNSIPFCYYWCNVDDPFVVIQFAWYTDFFYIAYINDKIIVQVSNSTAGNEMFINDIKDYLNTKNIINSNNILNFKNKYLLFGFVNNVGHNLWQDVSGLFYFLENKNYHQYINGIVFGPCDPFNMKNYIKSNYNFKIVDYNNISLEINFMPFYLNSFYIENDIKKIFPELPINIINENNIIELTFELRSSRCLLNQEEFYIFIITKLLNDDKFINYNFKINFCGRFSTNSLNLDKLNDIEYIDHINKFNNIINNIKSIRIIFINYIGENILTIIQNIYKTNMCILQMGTSVSNIMNWIYRTKCIVLCPSSFYRYQTIQYDVLKNFEAIWVPKEYNTYEGDNKFNVDYDLFYNLLSCNLV